jgi:hypothetical protein
MNNTGKNKIWIWLVILLVLANAGTLCFFWLSRPMPPESPAKFLSKELAFSIEQQKQFEQLVQQHRDSVRLWRDQLQSAKEEMYALVKEPAVSDSTEQVAAQKLGAIVEKIEWFTLDHFQQVRLICTPSQEKKFDAVLHKMLKMMSASRPMPPRGESGPPPPLPPFEK